MKLNLKGMNKEAVIGVTVLAIALVNAVITMFGGKVLPIGNDNVNEIVSTAFLVGTALYNTYKNRNISTASQVAQEVTDAIKNGEILVDDVKELLEKIKED